MLLQGTWQFMSAALLLNHYKMSKLEDDLESFFHVLLYIALRYLCHNFLPQDVAEFMNQYFDAMGHREHGMVGGHTKYTSFHSGQLVFNAKCFIVGPGPDYPLNDIINELLRWFRAFYAANTSEIVPTNQLEAHTFTPASKWDDDESEDKSEDEEDEEKSEDEDRASSSANTQRPEIQTADHSLAKKLGTHRAFYALFKRNSRESSRWVEDKVEDQLPPNYSPRTDRLYGDLASYATHSNIPQVAEGSRSSSKRAREHDEDSPNKRINAMGPRRSSRLVSRVSTRSASTASKS